MWRYLGEPARDGRCRLHKTWKVSPLAVQAWASTPLLQATIAVVVLKLDGNAFKFDLRIDRATIERGRAYGKGLFTFLAEHLRRLLSRALGRVPEFFFVVEYVVSGACDCLEHIHGIVGLRAGEEEKAKKAISSLGEFYKPKRLFIEEIGDAYSCANYATKDERYVRAAEGRSPLYMTRPLNRRARAVYELALQRHREMLRDQEREEATLAEARAA